MIYVFLLLGHDVCSARPLMRPRRLAYSLPPLTLRPAAITSDLRHLTSAFSATSALFARNGAAQLLFHQSLTHSFPLNGGRGVFPTFRRFNVQTFQRSLHPSVLLRTSRQSARIGPVRRKCQETKPLPSVSKIEEERTAGSASSMGIRLECIVRRKNPAGG